MKRGHGARFFRFMKMTEGRAALYSERMPTARQAGPDLRLRDLLREKRNFSREERAHLTETRGRFNASTVGALAALSGALFFLFWLGVQSGILVHTDSPLWPYYRAFFGVETILAAAYAAVRFARKDALGAGWYLAASIVFVVALNILGMLAAGDRSIYLLALMLCAFLYSAPIRWYVLVFSGAWVASIAGMAFVFPLSRLLSNSMVLLALTALSILTGVVLELHRSANAVLAMRLGARNRELREISLLDPLTGLYNRRFLTEWLSKEISRCRRESDPAPLTLALIDLDRFKEINDRAGHQAGDRAMRTAADIFRSALRSADVVARYGGDEFVAVLPGTSLTKARAIMERCLEALGEAGDGALPFPLTFSCGLASWRSGQDESELIGEADERLYRAKELGRNRVVAEAVSG